MILSRLKVVAIIGFVTTFCFIASAQVTKPDFAYPQKVSTQAKAALKAALATGNGPMTVRALIDLTIAEGSISNDSVASALKRIDEVREQEMDNATKSLLALLEAYIYTSVYENNRYVFDTRQLPSIPLPPDYNEWSGEQFKNKIRELASSALANKEALMEKPLREYRNIIATDQMTLQYYPTLYDFVAHSAIGILSEISAMHNILPMWRLCNADKFVSTSKFVPSSAIATEILTIYADLLEFHKNDAAPYVNTDISRINFIGNSVYSLDYADVIDDKHTLFGELYDRFIDSEYSGDVLIALSELDDNTGDKKLYEQVRRNIKKFPNYCQIACLKNIEKRCASKSISLNMPEVVAPGKKFDVKVNVTNYTDLRLTVYKVPRGFDSYYQFNPLKAPTPISSTRLTLNREIPFKSDTVMTMAIAEPGHYIIVGMPANGASNDIRSISKVYCTDLSTGTVYFDKLNAMVVSPLTGKPVDGAEINLVKRNGTMTAIGQTNHNGIASITFPGNSNGGRILAIKGTDRYSLPIYTYEPGKFEPKKRHAVKAFTNLAIYHPGDSVDWSAVTYWYVEKQHSVEPGMTVKATLRNVNYQTVDTIEAISDEFGRIKGRFAIPEGELTGYYTIGFERPDNNNAIEHLGSINFMVSDYKLPTFIVEVTDIDQNDQSKPVSIGVKARSYSGIAMSGGRAVLNLSVNERYRWWMSNSIPVYSDTVTLDNNGCGTLIVPMEVMEMSVAPNGLFTAKIAVTSTTGETQFGTKAFSLSKMSRVIASIPSNIDVDKPVKLNVEVENPSGEKIASKINYEIVNGGQIVRNGSFESPNPTVDWNTVPGGCYTIKLTTADGSSDTLSVNNVGIYRPSDKMPPKDMPIWLPKDKYEVEKSAKILFGTSANESHILYTLWNNDGVIEQNWMEKKAGMHILDVTLPANVNEAIVTLFSVNDFRSSCVEMTLKRKDSEQGIAIKASAFRDHLTPGAEETWTFEVTAKDGSAVTAAMMLNMYNQALDQLASQASAFHPQTGQLRHLTLSTPRFRDISSYYSAPISFLNCRNITAPTFNTYGLNVTGNNRRMMKMSNLARTTVLGSNDFVEEAEDEVVMSESQVMMSAAGSMDGGSYGMSQKREAAIMTDMNEEASSDDADEENGASPNGDADKATFSYRNAEVASAFFCPMLTTDCNGHLKFTFTVPNANATWHFNALAFTKDLLTTEHSANVVSNKPLMVQPNLPRFLRSGDTAIIEANVANNSDSALSVRTTVETFNPSTGKVLSEESFESELYAETSAVVSVKVNAPTDVPFIGYRIKSETSEFSDGEQSVISILPATTPVIETAPFYMQNGQKELSMKLPNVPTEARVTLQFCENPIWYVVTALPGISKSEMRTSVDAATALFATSVAEGIVRNNPSIAAALETWSKDKSDSTLTSMLSRNADLKTMLLQATPWMMDAASDNERMERLALLLDRKEIAKTTNKAINVLKKLQRGSNGWAWIEESDEASEWATHEVLSVLGRSNQLGFLPNEKELQAMIDIALRHIQDVESKRYAKYPKSDFTSFVRLLDLWPEFKPSATASTIASVTMQRILRDWKKYSTADNASAAIMLYRHSYKTSAKAILQSLREFAVTTAEGAMTWPSINESAGSSIMQLSATSNALEAFKLIEPDSPDIEKIVQWLILQKEAQNWGRSTVASEVIASIIKSVPQWTSNASDAITATVDGRAIKISNTEKILGYFRTPLPDASNAILSIKRNDAQGISWGAVYTQYTNKMEDVKENGNETLSISKRLYKKSGNNWIEATELHVGDIVKVELTVKSGRDIQYVAIDDERAAALEPLDQTPTPLYSEGICFYRENRDSSTNFFITNLPKGTYMISYELSVNNAGTFASGIATIQSQYAPELSAHSSGTILKSTPMKQ